MKAELQKKLFDKYPKIFVQKDLPMIQTCMCWGIDCGDGWYWLIDQLCGQLQWDIDKNGELQLKASQVKEKFGSLRFYIDGGSIKQFSMITLAETMSSSICELCGSTKNIGHTQGWIFTWCKECAEKDTGNRIWIEDKDENKDEEKAKEIVTKIC